MRWEWIDPVPVTGAPRVAVCAEDLRRHLHRDHGVEPWRLEMADAMDWARMHNHAHAVYDDVDHDHPWPRGVRVTVRVAYFRADGLSALADVVEGFPEPQGKDQT